MIPYKLVNGVRVIEWLVTDVQDRPMADAENLTDARKKAYALKTAKGNKSVAYRIYHYGVKVGFVGFDYRAHKMCYSTTKNGSRVNYVLYRNGKLGGRL